MQVFCQDGIRCELDHRSVLPLNPDYTLHRLVIADGCTGSVCWTGDVVMGGFSSTKVMPALRVLAPSES